MTFRWQNHHPPKMMRLASNVEATSHLQPVQCRLPSFSVTMKVVKGGIIAFAWKRKKNLIADINGAA